MRINCVIDVATVHGDSAAREATVFIAGAKEAANLVAWAVRFDGKDSARLRVAGDQIPVRCSGSDMSR